MSDKDNQITMSAITTQILELEKQLCLSWIKANCNITRSKEISIVEIMPFVNKWVSLFYGDLQGINISISEFSFFNACCDIPDVEIEPISYGLIMVNLCPHDLVGQTPKK